MATPKIIASPHAAALSGELKTKSSSRVKVHTATTPARVTNRLARSFMASPGVPPYFSLLLFIFCNSGCVNPERNKASSVTFISSRPLFPKSVFPIADYASNHNDELYSNPAETFRQIPSPLSYYLGDARTLRQWLVSLCESQKYFVLINT